MSTANKLFQAASGVAADSVFVEDVFSTYLYYGNSGTQAINNGIDLSGEGGLVWLKSRTNAAHHELSDTERGVDATNGRALHSNDTSANVNGELEAFNSNGFTLGFNTADGNSSGQDYVSWTWRKQEKFFDVLTYTGNGSNRTISHNLGSVPGVMIVKRTSATEGWQVYHRNLATDEYIELNTNSAKSNSNGTLRWNSTRPTATELSLGTHDSVNASGSTYVAYLFGHTPTSDFVEDDQEYYANGSSISGFNGSGEYRIYVSGSTTYYNAGTSSGNVSGADNFSGIEALIETNTGQAVRTGALQTSSPLDFYSIITTSTASSPVDDEESLIVCGNYIGNGSSTGPVVSVGFEPQWLMIRNTGGGNWVMLDVMRGMDLSNIQHIYADTTQAGQAAGSGVVPTADGFRLIDNSPLINQDSETHVYIAIRRPMKTPEAGTDVFSVYGYTDATLTSGGITASNRTMINGGANGGSGFPVDTFMHKTRTTATYGLHVFDRIRGKGKSLLTDETSASPAGDGATNSGFDYQEGVDVEYNGEMYYYTTGAGNRTHVTYHWKRAPNFFQTVLYTGNGANRTITHNLAQAPKFMFIKRHNGSRNWIGYFASLGNTKYLLGAGGSGTGQNPAATDDGTRFNSTTPTSSVFSLGTNEDVNGTNMQYVAYLWGDVDGVSKVGSYSSDGSGDITVTTGFTPSFVLIKCSSHTSTNWIYFDDHRGLGAGTKLYWNDDAAESSDSDYVITTTSTTMTIKRGADEINSTSSGRDYVFLAVA